MKYQAFWIVFVSWCPLPFRKEKRGLWYCLCSFNRSSIRLSDWTKLCRCHNSAITGPIHSKLGSLQPSWPVDVQCHAHLLFQPFSYGWGPSGDLLVMFCAFAQCTKAKSFHNSKKQLKMYLESKQISFLNIFTYMFSETRFATTICSLL